MRDDDDPFGAPARKPVPLAVQLENASIEDLEKRIVSLREEIALCEAEIGKKRAQRGAADAFFTTKR